MSKKTEKKERRKFSEKHPKLYGLYCFAILMLFVYGAIEAIRYLIEKIGNSILWLVEIVSGLDVVLVVALISGTVSIIGVIVSSIVAKMLDYRRAKREYLTQKREKPYGEYIDMIYKIQQSSKPGKSYPQEEMVEDLLQFSKQITLWGSPRVVRNWVKFREIVMKGNKGIDNLLITEQLMNDMRKDLGLPRVKKGNLLAFFINDIKAAMKK